MLLHDTLRPAGLHIALLALFRTLPDKYQTLPGYVPPFGGEVLMGDWFRVSSMGIGMMEAISPCMSGRSNEKTPCAAPLAPDKTKQLVFGCIDKGGIRHFDTAQEYKAPDFTNLKARNPLFAGKLTGEEQLGLALKGQWRESYTVATKYSHGWPHYLEELEQGIDESRARLGMDYIDLFYLHRPITGLKDLNDLKTAMLTLKGAVEKGKIKHVGLSEVGTEWLRFANSIHPVAAIQMEWSLVSREIEAEIVPLCRELNIGIVAYAPLARLLLAVSEEELNDEIAKTIAPAMGVIVPRFDATNLPDNLALMRKVAAMAKEKGCTTAQLSLAWLYHKAAYLGVTVVAIPGTSHVEHAIENAKALNVKLNDEEMVTLEKLGALSKGARGSESYMQITFETQQGNHTSSGYRKYG